MLDVYAVQICLNIYLSFHLCQMFALSFFNFSLQGKFSRAYVFVFVFGFFSEVTICQC